MKDYKKPIIEDEKINIDAYCLENGSTYNYNPTDTDGDEGSTFIKSL